MPGASSSGLLAPTFGADDGELQLSSQQPVRLDEHVQILPRLEGRNGEDVRGTEIRGRPVRVEDVLRRGMRDADPLASARRALR